MPGSIPTSKVCISCVIVLLFVYAYKNFYKNRLSTDCNDNGDNKKGLLSSLRKENPKKVEIVEPKPNGELTESGKEKISRLVEGILKRQIPE